MGESDNVKLTKAQNFLHARFPVFPYFPLASGIWKRDSRTYFHKIKTRLAYWRHLLYISSTFSSYTLRVVNSISTWDALRDRYVKRDSSVP
jgi:hypothetical protein